MITPRSAIDDVRAIAPNLSVPTTRRVAALLYSDFEQGAYSDSKIECKFSDWLLASQSYVNAVIECAVGLEKKLGS